jgi:hypothetical protein
MGLIGGIARVAAVSATATATSNAVNRRMAKKNVAAYGNAQEQYTEDTGASAPPAPAVAVGAGPSPGNVMPAQGVPAAAPAGDDLAAKIQQLADLHAQGILTDEEFAEAKAKLLG